MPEVEFKKIKVHYSDTGKGRVIVLLHGFLGSHTIWEQHIKKLSKKFRVIAIDLLGHGKTPALGYYHSMELLAQSVKAVLNHIGVRRYVIAGHSMGGYTALAFADLYPENICGLCLVHSTAYSDLEAKRKDRDRLIKLVKKGRTEFVNEIISNLFTPEYLSKFPKEVAKVQHIAAGVSKQAIINSLEGMKERKGRDLILKFTEYPVLFIVGKKDNIINYETIYPQIGLCKYPTVLMMENEGHMGFYESPKEPINEIEKFSMRCFRGNFD